MNFPGVLLGNCKHRQKVINVNFLGLLKLSFLLKIIELHVDLLEASLRTAITGYFVIISLGQKLFLLMTWSGLKLKFILPTIARGTNDDVVEFPPPLGVARIRMK